MRRQPPRMRPLFLRRVLSVLALLTGATVPPALVHAQQRYDTLPSDLPAWVHEVGARKTPSAIRTCTVSDYGARPDTTVDSTRGIQQAIDACAAAGGGRVTFSPGAYLTGALFVKSGVDLHVGQDVTLYGSHDDADYPERPTRVAGIEMTWPVGLINVDGQQDVRISGQGTIDGRGEKWWNLYWNMRRNDYEPRGLRWAVDYDAQRVRLLVVSKSSDITVEGLHLKRSGFWTVHVLYSDHVTVDGLTISANQGPSTDGVDIDSSSRVLVRGNDIDNNDDTICLKSGRDADGLRVNRPTEYVFIHDNLSRRGSGILCFGSETSGGIRHVVAYRNRGVGTSEGIRFKSAQTRGGYVQDVLIRDLAMVDVPRPITFDLDWNPSYSYPTIPDSIENVPDNWIKLTTPVEPPERGLCDIHDLTIEDVRAVGARTLVSVKGLADDPIHDVHWKNVTLVGREAGSITYARDWTMENVTVLTPSGGSVDVTHSRGVPAPRALATTDEGAEKAGQTLGSGADAASTMASVALSLPDRDSILADLRLANRFFMRKWPDPGKIIVTDKARPSNIWTRAVYYEGLMALYRIDPRPAYYRYAVAWADFHHWDLRDGDTYTRNADDQAAGQTYIDLYRLDPQPGRIRAIKASIDGMMATDEVDDWSWIDAIQMAMPVFARLGVVEHDDAYFERMWEMYQHARNEEGDHGLYNPADGLWWRDADFDPPHTSPAGENVYWSRGNGWVLMALARVLDVIPHDAPHRDAYVRDFRAMAAALVPLQRDDGFWNVSLEDPTQFGGPETSGTAMFTYGLAWGIHHGLLDASTYGPLVDRAWHALAHEALHENGFLGWVQSTGKQPSDGQPLGPDKVPDFEDYALGAFLLAGSEVYALAGR